MDTGYYKFYISKLRLFLLFIVISLLFYLSFITYSNETVSDEKILCVLGMVLFGVGAVFCFIKIFSNTAYIEITPTYIKLGKTQNLLREDIEGVRFFRLPIKNAGKVLAFDIKENATYNLTKSQQRSIEQGYPAFIVSTSLLSRKDFKKLKEILKEHIANHDID